jgi:succinate dehydrogenase / fumarate reductase, cytochrome b subunit
MSDRTAKPRPQFKNIGVGQILTYRLPLAGRVSILHRISGALLFLLLPVLILPLFAMSFTSESGFAALAVVVGFPVVKIILLVLLWAYLHHFCAGIRYLVLDLHHGLDKHSAQKSAGLVLGVSLALTLVFGLKLFGAW